MPKFKVTFRYASRVTVEVEAPTETAAYLDAKAEIDDGVIMANLSEADVSFRQVHESGRQLTNLTGVVR